MGIIAKPVWLGCYPSCNMGKLFFSRPSWRPKLEDARPKHDISELRGRPKTSARIAAERQVASEIRFFSTASRRLVDVESRVRVEHM